MPSEFIHRFIPASRPGLPTILALHGTGGDEEDLIPVARMVGPGSAILSPRGQVLEHGMPRFFRRLAEGVFDLDDLRLRTRELGDFVAWAAGEYDFDPSRVYAVGYSNGANVAASLLLSRPALLAGGLLLRPMIPFEPESPPDLHGKALLLSAGRRDAIVAPALTERLAALMTGLGADVTLAWQDTGHQMTRAELEAAVRWFVQRVNVA